MSASEGVDPVVCCIMLLYSEPDLLLKCGRLGRDQFIALFLRILAVPSAA